MYFTTKLILHLLYHVLVFLYIRFFHGTLELGEVRVKIHNHQSCVVFCLKWWECARNIDRVSHHLKASIPFDFTLYAIIVCSGI